MLGRIGWYKAKLSHFCPLCKKYLQKLESLKDKFLAQGAEVLALSGDPEDKGIKMVESAKLSIPVDYSLSIQ